MKEGQKLSDIAIELERQLTSRRDYIAKESALKIEAIDGDKKDVVLSGINGSHLSLTDLAHDQMASRLEIPRKYYDKMREEAPKLLADNINTWLSRSDAPRMVRTLDNKVRAFLSDRYRPLDNYDLANAALPTLQEAKATIISSQVTESRFYIKAIYPDLCGKVPEGLQLGQGHNFTREDMVIASVTISNSEVGAGSLRVEAGFFKTRCTNLAIFDGSAMRKYHVGRSAVSELDNAVEYFTDETRKADDKAFWMKVRDIVRGSCNKELFDSQLLRLTDAAKERIDTNNIPKVIEITRKKLNIADQLQNNILQHLIQGGDLTKWGLMNAITRTAEDVSSYDLATDLERAGGKILELPQSEWKQIAQVGGIV